MALPDLTGINIENSYQRVVHTDGTNYYNGTGSLLNLGPINTGSFATTSSFNAFTSSYNTGSFTGSFTGDIIGTASFSQTASYVNPLNQDVQITGSLSVSGSVVINNVDIQATIVAMAIALG